MVERPQFADTEIDLVLARAAGAAGLCKDKMDLKVCELGTFDRGECLGAD